MALFSDEVLYAEIAAKSSFWLQQNYYGVNITHLHAPSVDGYFSQVRTWLSHRHWQGIDCVIRLKPGRMGNSLPM